MNFPFSPNSSGGLFIVVGIFGFLQLILWLVIGWRAMRAHEDIATTLQSLVRHIRMRDEEQVAREQNRERRAPGPQE